MRRVKTLQKDKKKCKTLGNLIDKNRENLDDQGCPKHQELFDPKAEKNVVWLELPTETQDHTLLCRSQGKIA